MNILEPCPKKLFKYARAMAGHRAMAFGHGPSRSDENIKHWGGDDVGMSLFGFGGQFVGNPTISGACGLQQNIERHRR